MSGILRYNLCAWVSKESQIVLHDAVTRGGFLEEMDRKLDGSYWMADLKLEEIYDQS